MNKTGLLAVGLLCLAAGVLTLVTAASMNRRTPPVVARTSPVGVPSPGTSSAGTPATTPGWLTEYTLTERSGREFHSHDLDGQVHVVNFFFASCPSYCRMQSGEVQKLAREFGPQGVVFLSITCDPQADTPAALAEYARLFNADPRQWLFLTGDLLLTRRIGGEMYQLHVDKQVHTEHLVVVDRWGKVRGRYQWKNHPEELEEMKTVLAALLAETEPPDEPPPAAPAPAAGDEAEPADDAPGNEGGTGEAP